MSRVLTSVGNPLAMLCQVDLLDMPRPNEGTSPTTAVAWRSAWTMAVFLRISGPGIVLLYYTVTHELAIEMDLIQLLDWMSTSEGLWLVTQTPAEMLAIDASLHVFVLL